MQATCTRRVSLWLLVSLLASACGGGNSGSSGPPTAPTPATTSVTQILKIFTSDGTSLGALTFEGRSDTPLVVTMQTLRDRGIDTASIDSNFFVVREDNQSDRLGSFVANTSTGRLEFFPASNSRVLWMMNSSNGANYSGAWATGLGREDIRSSARYSTVIRLTATNNTSTTPGWQIEDGDMTRITEGLDILNQCWRVGGVVLASLTYLGDAATGNIKAGIGTHTSAPTAAGVHSGNQFMINPITNRLPVGGRNVAAAEAFETMFRFDDLFGSNTSPSLFGNGSTSELVPAGRDYVRFGALFARP